MSALSDDLNNRRNAAGQVVVGGALVGGAAGADYGLNRRLAGKGRAGVLRSVGRSVVRSDKPGFKAAVHLPHAAGKAGVRGMQLAGLPLLAYGAKNALSARPKATAPVRGADVAASVVHHATYQDQVDAGRKTVAKFDDGKLSRRKKVGSALSLAGGTMGLTALGLRAPGAARAISHKIPKLAAKTAPNSFIPKPAGRAAGALHRLAAKEPSATKASNTLGVLAIGTGSANSFNWASQQRLETKRDAEAKRETASKALPLRLLGGAASAAAGAVGGATYGPTVAANHHASELADPDRAKKLARDLADTSVGTTRHAQRSAYEGLERANRDVKHLRPAADRWSKSMKRVTEIKGQDGRARPGVLETLAHPLRAKANADARTINSVLGQAPKNKRTLYRGTFVAPRHKVAVTEDTPTSWAVGRQAPEHMLARHEHLGRYADKKPALVKKPRGAVQALNISAATPHFREGSAAEQITRTRARTDTDGVTKARNLAKAFSIEDHQVPTRDDRFLRENRDRISPKAEQGYRYLKAGRNRQRGEAAASGVMAGMTGALTVHELHAKNKLSAAVTAASTLGTAINARHSAQGARAWNGHLQKIKTKAHERVKAGLYAPGRGKTPVDSSSAQARNLAKAMGVAR